jgi:hypothetical protein
MALALNYAGLLRPVGQILESLRIDNFTLRIEDAGVSVRGQKPKPRNEPAPPQAVSLRVVWQSLRGKKQEPIAEPQPSSGILELHYTHEDIGRVDDEAKSRRVDSAGRPEAHALSQILRAVGGVVDQKQGRLISVTKEGQDITVEYDSTLKQKIVDKFTSATLYDFWVRMYLRRSSRS